MTDIVEWKEGTSNHYIINRAVLEYSRLPSLRLFTHIYYLRKNIGIFLITQMIQLNKGTISVIK